MESTTYALIALLMPVVFGILYVIISWACQFFKKGHAPERDMIRQSANKIKFQNSQKEIEVFTYDREPSRLGPHTRVRHYVNWSVVTTKLTPGNPPDLIESKLKDLESLNVEPTIDCLDYK